MTTAERKRLESIRDNLIHQVPGLDDDPYFLLHFVAGPQFGEVHVFTSRAVLTPAMRSTLRRLGAVDDASQGFWATHVHEFPIMAVSIATEMQRALSESEPEKELLYDNDESDGEDTPESLSEPYGERRRGAVALECLVSAGGEDAWLAQCVRTSLDDLGEEGSFWSAERLLAFVVRRPNGKLHASELRQLGLESRRVGTGEITPTFEDLDAAATQARRAGRTRPASTRRSARCAQGPRRSRPCRRGSKSPRRIRSCPCSSE